MLENYLICHVCAIMFCVISISHFFLAYSVGHCECDTILSVLVYRSLTYVVLQVRCKIDVILF